MSPSNSHIILECKALSVGYTNKKKSIEIQKDINLEVRKGEFVAVLGRNGIGKSTLLRTITKVQNPLHGSVLINQKNLQSFNALELSNKVSVVLTERLPESQLTVFELVALGRQPYTNWMGLLTENDHQKVLWALEQTETLEFADKHFYELSDGQLQRVMIARALAQDTDIIVLDEPTAHLDMHHTIKIFQLLKQLVQDTQKTIIISSHQVNLAIQLADQIVLITEKEVTSGVLKELIERKAFDELFPSEILNFDPALEQFVLQKK
jgi:iron complex transport system ATP-binding protein